MRMTQLIILFGLIIFSCERQEKTQDDLGEKNSHRISEIVIVRPEVFDIRIKFTYSGEKISEVVYHGTDAKGSIWVPFIKINYSYNGNCVSAVRSEIKTTDWRISDKVDFIVENGKVIEETSHDYINSKWVLQSKISYSYEESGLTGFQSYKKDTATNGLISVYRGEYKYVNDTLKEYIRYKFFDEYVSLPDDRYIFDYAAGNMKSITAYVQDLNDEWTELAKYEFLYFASAPSESRLYKWSEENESWVDELTYLRYSYNNFGYLTKELFYDGLDYTYNYETGHGNAALFYYHPDELVFGEPTLKSASEITIQNDIFDRIYPHKSMFSTVNFRN